MEAKQSGSSLRDFLKAKLSAYSVRHIKWAIEKGFVFVNERAERHSTRALRRFDKVSCLISHLEKRVEKKLVFEKKRLVFEDEDFLIYDKPPSIVSTEGGMLSLLQEHYPSLLAVHRLDKDTSGVLVFAKSKAAFEHIKEQFSKRELLKTYLAIVDGLVEKKDFMIDQALEGKSARTRFIKLSSAKAMSVLRCFPESGRKHQIRLHLKSLAHPIMADYHYQKSFLSSYKPERMLLHAESISFRALDNTLIKAKAFLAKDFQQALSYMKLSSNILV